MRSFLVLALLSLTCCGFLHENMDKFYYLRVNAPFEVYDPEENPFRDWTEEQLRELFTLQFEYPEFDEEEEEEVEEDNGTTFDARTNWPNCVQPIRNQESCGSCWAFSGAVTLSWRFCISSGGSINVPLSTQDSVSCDTSNMACDGGYLSYTWKYYKNTGIVSDTCFPYTAGQGNVESCATSCKNGETWKKYKVSSYTGYKTKSTIQAELKSGGPVQTGFTVYNDFMNYSSGIYEYVSGSNLGGHAVIIIGWGNENGTDYWICQNSWGASWGENGYFRIKMGECGIDSDTYGGVPKI